MNRGNSYYRGRDDASTLDTTLQPPVRHIYELNVGQSNHPLPPRVSGNVIPQAPSGNNSQGGSVSTQNAGSAFGRRPGQH